MAELTDPAHEFASLCRALSKPANEKGVDWLASKFNTEPHSYEFYQILFTIVERANHLKQITLQIPEAAHIAPQIENNINHILVAFQAPHLAQSWKTHGSPYLQADNVSPILILSAVVRNHFAYPLLDEEDRADLLSQVDELLGWLEGHQLSEQDFIRQALIDGLRQFKFRVERLQWLGWGFTLQSLRDVIAAYMALERGFTDENSMPVVAATLKKVGDALRAIYTTAGVAKDTVESADFILKAYGAASMVAHAKIGGIAGLITFTGAAS